MINVHVNKSRSNTITGTESLGMTNCRECDSGMLPDVRLGLLSACHKYPWCLSIKRTMQ